MTSFSARPAKKRRINYELVTCGLEGHYCLSGGENPRGPVEGRFQCARCGDLVTAGGGRMIRGSEPPLRGEALRERYVLRLIAVDRAVHVIVLAGLAVAIFFFSSHQAALRASYLHVLNALYGNGGGGTAHGFLARLRKYFDVTPSHLRQAGAAVVGYGVLEATEMIGLWKGRRWAEYLTLLATALLLPLEIYELAHSVTVLKLLTFIINLAIVFWLLWNKRLFGLRGGAATEQHELEEADPIPDSV
jgi:uncharacterized membrane protein (DUF2068 family)